MDCYAKHWNAKEAKKDGKPLTLVDRVIMLRSKLTHSEKQYSSRYRNVSWSFTKADGANGARFKKIAYSHPKRWVTDVLELSDIEEDRSFREACRLADVTPIHVQLWLLDDSQTGILRGPNHAKYDTIGLLTHCLKKHNKGWVNVMRKTLWWWTAFVKPDMEDMWCSEGVGELIKWATFLRRTGGILRHFAPCDLDPQELHEALSGDKT